MGNIPSGSGDPRERAIIQVFTRFDADNDFVLNKIELTVLISFIVQEGFDVAPYTLVVENKTPSEIYVMDNCNDWIRNFLKLMGSKQKTFVTRAEFIKFFNDHFQDPELLGNVLKRLHLHADKYASRTMSGK